MSQKIRFKNKPSNKKSIIASMVIVIILLFWLLIFTNKNYLYQKLYNKDNQNTWNISSWYNNKYYIWQNVSFTWKISQNLDFGVSSSFSHIFQTIDEKFGLISKNIDLGNQEIDVEIDWNISSYQNWLYIITIDKISTIWNIEESNNDSSGNINDKKEWYEYISSMNIWINSKELWNWSYSVDYTNERVNFVDSLNVENKFQLDYFLCNENNESTNCQSIKNMYWFTNPEIITQAWQSIYQIPDTSSWFMENDNMYWYYFSVTNSETMNILINNIDFISDRFVFDRFLPNAKTLCDNWYGLSDVVNKKIESWRLIVDFEDNFGSIYTCNMNINPELNLWLEFVDISKKESDNTNTWELEDSIEDDLEDSNQDNDQNIDDSINKIKKDESVVQFDIDLDNYIDFTAREWYKIKFPSKNIRFEWVNMSQDRTLWFVWLYCYVQLNVIEYQWDDETSKQIVEADPSVTVYVCNKKDELIESLSEKFFVKKDLNDSKMFLISIVKPEFYDFWENIQIE